MKKNCVIFISAFLYSFSLFSQKPLLRDNYFLIGNHYPAQSVFDIHIDTIHKAGNNVIWNFSNITLLGSNQTTALDPSQTPFYNYYTNTQLCLNSLTGYLPSEENMYSYFNASNDEISFAGEWADNAIWEFTYYRFPDPEKYYEFPFYFGYSFTDEYLSTGFDMSGTGRHKSWGTRNVTADGFGILVMPNKTYSNCLRLKAIINHTDSCSVFGITSSMFCQYTWFDLETNGPVLEVQLWNDLSFDHARYYYNNPLVSATNNLYENSITLSPVPVTDKLKIQFHQEVPIVECNIYTVTGIPLLSFTQTNLNSIDIPVQHLPSGVYFLKIINKASNITRKFIKQ